MPDLLPLAVAIVEIVLFGAFLAAKLAPSGSLLARICSRPPLSWLANIGKVVVMIPWHVMRLLLSPLLSPLGRWQDRRDHARDLELVALAGRLDQIGLHERADELRGVVVQRRVAQK